MTGPRDSYDDAVSALRSHIEDLAIWITIWEARNEPDAHARRCASDAVDAIDSALRDLHSVRQDLISQIRQSDDASAIRADKLLAGSERSNPGPAGPEDTEARGAEDTPGPVKGNADEQE